MTTSRHVGFMLDPHWWIPPPYGIGTLERPHSLLGHLEPYERIPPGVHAVKHARCFLRLWVRKSKPQATRQATWRSSSPYRGRLVHGWETTTICTGNHNNTITPTRDRRQQLDKKTLRYHLSSCTTWLQDLMKHISNSSDHQWWI
jgi:hypothetical protein